MWTLSDVRKQIKFNYKYSEVIKKIILWEHNKNQKLELITYLSSFNANCITSRYSDEILEKELVNIGQTISFKKNKVIKKNHILHVMTKAFATGGHTGVVNNWIDFDNDRTYSIAFTDSSFQEVPYFLKNTVEKSGGKLHILHSNLLIDKAKELLNISQEYEKIILHIHMYDVVPILAYSNKNWSTPIYFYNHANFRFSLGMSITDCMLNIVKYDLVKSERYRDAKRCRILPSPLKPIENNIDNISYNKKELRNFLEKKYGFSKESKVIVSMGADVKYKKIVGYDFIRFVKTVLDCLSQDTYFFIIGANPDSKRWKQLYFDTNGHARALGVISRDSVSELIKISDVYITSFPMNSSGSDEAKRYNIKTFTLKTLNRATEYFDKDFYNDEKELIDGIINYLKTERVSIYKEKNYKNIWNDPEEWKNILNKIFEEDLKHTVKEFKPRRLISKEELINCQLLQSESHIEYENMHRFNFKNICFLSFLRAYYIFRCNMISKELNKNFDERE